MSATQPANSATNIPTTTFKPNCLVQKHNETVDWLANMNWVCCSKTVRKLEITQETSFLTTIGKVAIFAIVTLGFTLWTFVSCSSTKNVPPASSTGVPQATSNAEVDTLKNELTQTKAALDKSNLTLGQLTNTLQQLAPQVVALADSMDEMKRNNVPKTQGIGEEIAELDATVKDIKKFVIKSMKLLSKKMCEINLRVSDCELRLDEQDEASAPNPVDEGDEGDLDEVEEDDREDDSASPSPTHYLPISKAQWKEENTRISSPRHKPSPHKR